MSAEWKAIYKQEKRYKSSYDLDVPSVLRYEEKNGKDLCDFTVDEYIAFFKDRQFSVIDTIQVYYTTIREYCDICVKHGFTTNRAICQITPDMLMECLYKTFIPNEQALIDEMQRIKSVNTTARMFNIECAAYLLWAGFTLEEIVKIKKSDLRTCRGNLLGVDINLIMLRYLQQYTEMTSFNDGRWEYVFDDTEYLIRSMSKYSPYMKYADNKPVDVKYLKLALAKFNMQEQSKYAYSEKETRSNGCFYRLKQRGITFVNNEDISTDRVLIDYITSRAVKSKFNRAYSLYLKLNAD